MTTGADHGEIAEAGSPVQVPADPVDAVRPLHWMTGIVAGATLFLALFNAAAIGEWFDELPPSPLTEPLHAPIAAWVTTTRRLGLDTPRTAVRTRWEAARAARFGKEKPGGGGAE